MFENKHQQVLDNLYTDKYTTAKELANAINISEKTVRNRINELNKLLRENDCEIISKHGKGYKLKIEEGIEFKEIIKDGDKASIGYIPKTPAERVFYILVYLLNRNEFIKIEEICDFLYVSRNTVTADMKNVEYILNSNELKLERRPNYGIKVVGNEIDKRICLANSATKFNTTIMKNPNRIKRMKMIGEVLLEIFNKHNIEISETSFDRLVVHIYVNTIRFHRNNILEPIKSSGKEIVSNEIINLAKEISSGLEKTLGIKYNKDEVIYLGIHLSGKISPDNKLFKSTNCVISDTVNQLVTQMLNHIYEIMHLDIRNDLELIMNLCQHMVPFDIRMKYGIPLKNPIVESVKHEFNFAYTLASEASVVLNDYYQKKIPEDEIGFFAMILALAIEKRHKEIVKKNIIIVYVSEKSSTQLFKYKYKKAFGDYIDNIYECTVNELKSFDFKKKKIDYIFTTTPLELSLPVPVCEVNLFPQTNEIMYYREMFEKGDVDFLKKYYNETMFIPNLACKDKASVIKYMCEHAQQHYDLPKDFYEAVMKREDAGQTDFVDLIAAPHPYKLISKENFVVAAVLEEPVFWGHYDVQTVFLIVLATEKEQDVERFYQVTTDFLFNKEKVKLLIETPKYEELIKLLSEPDF